MNCLRPDARLQSSFFFMVGLLAFMNQESFGAQVGLTDYLPLDHVPIAEPTDQARRFSAGSQWVWVVSQCIAMALPLIFLFTPVAVTFEKVAWRLGAGRRVPAVALYVCMLMLLGFIIRLPWSYAAGYLRLKAFGLSNQTSAGWLGDSLKSLAVGIVIQAFVVGLVWGLLVVKFPRTWWFWTAAGTMPFLVFGVFLAPLLIDPLFNKFGPMTDKQLEQEILELANRTGVGQSRVFEVDKSRQTKAVNAYVTGMFGSKRIVLWDTLLKAMPAREVKAVVAHELGHYVLGHVRLGVLMGGVSAFGGMFLLNLILKWFVALYGDRLEITHVTSLAAIPLVLLIVTLGELFMAPVSNAVSRYMEHEADRFAIELTRDPAAFSKAFVALQRENLSVPFPGWFYRTWRATHPSIGERITFGNTYRPWVNGQPGRYDGLIQFP